MKKLKGKADERKKRSDQSGKENCRLVTPFVNATLPSYRSKLCCTKGKMGQFIVKVLI